MERKYELLKDDTIKISHRTLYRIKALRDFGNVKKDELGGYIEKENNLSHNECCWVSGTVQELLDNEDSLFSKLSNI